MSTPRQQTQLAEMVETHNIALSIKRLRNLNHDYRDTDAWARAVYHAILLHGPQDTNQRTAIRTALKLP